jgi:hypothetical protein
MEFLRKWNEPKGKINWKSKKYVRNIHPGQTVLWLKYSHPKVDITSRTDGTV